jgi:hypothetical protein
MAERKGFLFVRDYRRRYRFLPLEPPGPIGQEFSKTRKIWEAARQKITRLNPRILLQEQAFEQAGRPGTDPIRIFHSDQTEERKAKTRFYFFLQRQRSRHLLALAGEALLVPISGLAMILPGPNIFFYFLAALMIIQGQAFRGISRILRKDYEFASSEALAEWEAAVEGGDEPTLKAALEKVKKAHPLEGLRKILWK